MTPSTILATIAIAAVIYLAREVRRLKRAVNTSAPPAAGDTRDLETRVRQLEIADQRRVLELLR